MRLSDQKPPRGRVRPNAQLGGSAVVWVCQLNWPFIVDPRDLAFFHPDLPRSPVRDDLPASPVEPEAAIFGSSTKANSACPRDSDGVESTARAASSKPMCGSVPTSDCPKARASSRASLVAVVASPGCYEQCDSFGVREQPIQEAILARAGREMAQDFREQVDVDRLLCSLHLDSECSACAVTPPNANTQVRVIEMPIRDQ